MALPHRPKNQLKHHWSIVSVIEAPTATEALKKWKGSDVVVVKRIISENTPSGVRQYGDAIGFNYSPEA